VFSVGRQQQGRREVRAIFPASPTKKAVINAKIDVAPPTWQEAIVGWAILAPWFPVRLAGTEVTEAFWASAAGDYCGCARRGTGLVGSRFPERITQITNAAEVLPFAVVRHPEPALPPADIPTGLGQIAKPDVVPVNAGTFSSCNQYPK
jgi:hypothetical protein